jgi:nitrite reductase/ring-hydroxylating ferredoxin subunit
MSLCETSTSKMEFLRACHLHDLSDPGALEVRLPLGNGGLDIFLVRRRGEVRAYENRCPHTGAPLNWRRHDFLDTQGLHIVCATHAARFRIADGACLAGPCAGQGLSPLAVDIRGAEVFVRPVHS